VTRVKICGITAAEDAAAAVDAGADALGFVFVPGTERLVRLETVEQIVGNLRKSCGSSVAAGCRPSSCMGMSRRSTVAASPSGSSRRSGSGRPGILPPSGHTRPTPSCWTPSSRGKRVERARPSPGTWPGRPRGRYRSSSPAVSSRRRCPRPSARCGHTAWTSAVAWRPAPVARIRRK